MKSLLNRLPKKLALAITAMVLVAAAVAPVSAAFGPDRPTKVWTPDVEAFNHVTFNSFTNVGNGVGDERDFFRGVQVGRDGIWSDRVQDVSQDVEVEAKVYIHNGAKPSLNDAPGNPGIARNVKVRVALPEGSKQSQEAAAYISADNAQPGTVFDTMTVTGAHNGFFELDYVEGSAKLHKNGQVVGLSDSLVTTGVEIGDIKGCFEYVQEITFRVKVKMPNYTISKQITTPGSTDWKETLNAKSGDTVSWLVTFKNEGRTELKSVKIVDEVPAGLTVVPGSVKLVNGNYPDGYVFPDSAIQASGRQVNVDIGNYNPGILGYVTFRTTVDAEELECGDNKVVNKAFATPEGYGAIWDTAETVVNKDCAEEPKKEEPKKETPEALPKTGPASLVGAFGLTTAAGAVAHHLVIRRRK